MNLPREAINSPALAAAIIMALVLAASALIYIRFYRRDGVDTMQSAWRYYLSLPAIVVLTVLAFALIGGADLLHSYLNPAQP
jgi:hypothetical protein